MRVPQILIIALYTLSLGICLAKDGEPKDGTYSFGQSLIATALIFAILIWGGFFK